MYLSPSIIYEELIKTYTETSIRGSYKKEDLIKPPFIFTDKTIPETGNVYVGRGDDFDGGISFPEKSCIISCGEVKAPEFYQNIPVITVLQCESELNLYNEIQEIYEKFSHWIEEVSRMVISDVDIQSILDFCKPYFPGTFFLVVDNNYNVLATTAERSEVMDETGSTPASVLTRFKKDPTYLKTRYQKGTFLYDGKYFDHHILIHHLFINNELSGTFSMAEKETPITDGYWALFELLASYIDHCFQQRSYSIKSSYSRPNAIFARMLRGEIISDKVIADSISSLGWKINDMYRVCYIAINEADKMIGTSLYLCRKLDAQFISSFTMEYQGNILIILNISNIGPLSDISKSAMYDFLTETMLRAGISMEFTNLAMISSYYRQATAAYNIGIEKSNELVLYFSDVIIDYMVKNFSRGMLPESLCPRSLLDLKKHDEEKGSENLKTLDMYFRTGMNASQTAKLLFINRSTLLERLAKLWKTLEIDPDNYEQRLYLMLCLKILGY